MLLLIPWQFTAGVLIRLFRGDINVGVTRVLVAVRCLDHVTALNHAQVWAVLDLHTQQGAKPIGF